MSKRLNLSLILVPLAVLVLVCLACVWAKPHKIATLWRPVAVATKTPVVPTASPSSSPGAQIGSRLQIPAIGVDAPVISVDLTKDGNLDAPATLTEVGVYTDGPWPGQPGTAVVDGHSGAPGEAGVLEHLSQLKPGDLITIFSASGQKANFTVKTSGAYPDAPATATILFAKTAEPTMNLISCYGNWDAVSRTYDQRWIVTAGLEP